MPRSKKATTTRRSYRLDDKIVRTRHIVTFSKFLLTNAVKIRLIHNPRKLTDSIERIKQGALLVEIEKEAQRKIQAAEADRDKKVKAAKADRDKKVKAAEADRDKKVKAAKADRDVKVKAANADRDKKVKAANEDRDKKVKAANEDRDKKVKAAGELQQKAEEALKDEKEKHAETEEKRKTAQALLDELLITPAKQKNYWRDYMWYVGKGAMTTIFLPRDRTRAMHDDFSRWDYVCHPFQPLALNRPKAFGSEMVYQLAWEIQNSRSALFGRVWQRMRRPLIRLEGRGFFGEYAGAQKRDSTNAIVVLGMRQRARLMEELSPQQLVDLPQQDSVDLRTSALIGEITLGGTFTAIACSAIATIQNSATWGEAVTKGSVFAVLAARVVTNRLSRDRSGKILATYEANRGQLYDLARNTLLDGIAKGQYSLSDVLRVVLNDKKPERRDPATQTLFASMALLTPTEIKNNTCLLTAASKVARDGHKIDDLLSYCGRIGQFIKGGYAEKTINAGQHFQHGGFYIGLSRKIGVAFDYNILGIHVSHGTTENRRLQNQLYSDHIEDQAFAQLEGAVLSPISTEDPVMMARREQSYILAIQTLTVLARKEITFSSRKER